MLYVGIDGGGTSTKLEVRDEENRVEGRRTYGAFNISAIGEAGFRALMREIGAAENVRCWGSLCIGGAGVSSPGIGEMIQGELSAYGFAGKLQICSDSVIALRGAMDGPGCILIAGTGSIGYGENGSTRVRVGGWGHLIDDPGSGYAIGRDGLSATVQYTDGRSSARMLAEKVLDAIRGTGVQDVLNYVYFSGRGKAEIAALAPCVLQCAELGDETSLEILRKNANELKRIVTALADQLHMDSPRVALLGGLMTEGNAYRHMVEDALRNVAMVVPAQHDALWGAAQMAWETGHPEK